MPPRVGAVPTVQTLVNEAVIAPQQMTRTPGPQNGYVVPYILQAADRYDDAGNFIAPIATTYELNYGPAPLRIMRYWQAGLTMMGGIRAAGQSSFNSYVRLSPPPIIVPGRGMGGISMYAGKRSDNISRVPGIFVNYPTGA